MEGGGEAHIRPPVVVASGGSGHVQGPAAGQLLAGCLTTPFHRTRQVSGILVLPKCTETHPNFAQCPIKVGEESASIRPLVGPKSAQSETQVSPSWAHQEFPISGPVETGD